MGFKDKIQGRIPIFQESYCFGRVMPNFFILDSRVVGFSPSRSAAPFCPLTRQEVWFSTSMIWFRSTASSLRSLGKLGDKSARGLSFKILLLLIIMAFSIAFLSSRIFPSQTKGSNFLLYPSKSTKSRDGDASGRLPLEQLQGICL